VRLDHLLSKEQLAPLRPSRGAAAPRQPGPGRTRPGWCSWVEHRLVGRRAATARVSTRRIPLESGRGNPAAAAARRPGTLLGPEGTGISPSFWTARPTRPFPHREGARPAADLPATNHRAPDPEVGARQAPTAGNRTARSLRTAQWTRASLNLCGQVYKGTRWMSWHQEPMKDVGACDKPRGVGNRTVIRGCPNGETRLESCPVTRA
jgi:hypothetical protein